MYSEIAEEFLVANEDVIGVISDPSLPSLTSQ